MTQTIRGFAFPFRIDPASGGVATAEDKVKIRQNVVQILSTRLGERTMLRNFGSRLPGLVQEPNVEVLAKIAESQAREALAAWEPRIIVTSSRVDAGEGEGELNLYLEYVYSNTGETDQLGFPIG